MRLLGLLNNRVQYIVLADLKICKWRTGTKMFSFLWMWRGYEYPGRRPKVLHFTAVATCWAGKCVDMENSFTAVSGGSSADFGRLRTRQQSNCNEENKYISIEAGQENKLDIAPGRLQCGAINQTYHQTQITHAELKAARKINLCHSDCAKQRVYVWCKAETLKWI